MIYDSNKSDQVHVFLHTSTIDSPYVILSVLFPVITVSCQSLVYCSKMLVDISGSFGYFSEHNCRT